MPFLRVILINFILKKKFCPRTTKLQNYKWINKERKFEVMPTLVQVTSHISTFINHFCHKIRNELIRIDFQKVST